MCQAKEKIRFFEKFAHRGKSGGLLAGRLNGGSRNGVRRRTAVQRRAYDIRREGACKVQEWLKAIIAVLGSVVAAGLVAAAKRISERRKRRKERQDALEDGLRGLLHDRIHERYHECEAKGYADVRDRENMELLYEPYHALGGNGTGTDLYDRMRELPTAPPVFDCQPAEPAER